jgi:hypothetical protein
LPSGNVVVKLILEPDPLPSDSGGDLGLVVVVCGDLPPAVYPEEGAPRPDRHFLLGLAQTALVLVEEMDRDCAAALDCLTATLIRDGEESRFSPSFVITMTKEGKILVIGVGDPHDARRAARKTLRYFTGGVRLDVP